MKRCGGGVRVSLDEICVEGVTCIQSLRSMDLGVVIAGVRRFARRRKEDCEVGEGFSDSSERAPPDQSLEAIGR